MECDVTSEKWVGHFANLNKKDPSLEMNNEHVNFINKYVKSHLNNLTCSRVEPTLDAPFSTDEVIAAINTLLRNKAGGLDTITNNMLKAGRIIIAPLLVKLFNKILALQYFPKAWSKGLIIPIFKSGDMDDPDNYRGICLNSDLSKLFTGLLNTRLTKFLDDNLKISHNQTGFRKNFRTSDNLFTLKALIDKSMNNKEKLYTCFVDFSKAYDTIWRDGLFYKMLQSGISRNFVSLTKSIYANLTAQITLPDGLSKCFPSLVGVKQG